MKVNRIRTRSVECRGVPAVKLAVTLIAGMLSGCSVVTPWSMEPPPPHSAYAEAQEGPQKWIGKRLPDLINALGQPTSIEPLQETTGDLVIYSRPGFPHYVFETGPNGRIVTAAADN